MKLLPLLYNLRLELVVQSSVDQAANSGVPAWKKKAAAAAAAATEKKSSEQTPSGNASGIPEWKRKLLEMKKQKQQELDNLKAELAAELVPAAAPAVAVEQPPAPVLLQ